MTSLIARQPEARQLQLKRTFCPTTQMEAENILPLAMDLHHFFLDSKPPRAVLSLTLEDSVESVRVLENALVQEEAKMSTARPDQPWEFELDKLFPGSWERKVRAGGRTVGIYQYQLHICSEEWQLEQSGIGSFLDGKSTIWEQRHGENTQIVSTKLVSVPYLIISCPCFPFSPV